MSTTHNIKFEEFQKAEETYYRLITEISEIAYNTMKTMFGSVMKAIIEVLEETGTRYFELLRRLRETEQWLLSVFNFNGVE